MRHIPKAVQLALLVLLVASTGATALWGEEPAPDYGEPPEVFVFYDDDVSGE